MARATPSRSGDKPVDAIVLLKQDHRTVEELFEEFEDTEDGDAPCPAPAVPAGGRAQRAPGASPSIAYATEPTS